MAGGKRDAPSGGFDDTGKAAKAGNVAPRSIYEITLGKLRAGARRPPSQAPMDIDDEPQSTKCTQCSKSVSSPRKCDDCGDLFCTNCSTENFEQRIDRTFCLDCNVKDLQARSKRSTSKLQLIRSRDFEMEEGNDISQRMTRTTIT